MNYKTAYQIGKEKIKPYNRMQVVGADGSDLGAVGEIRCNIEVGDAVIQQDFIVCKHLRRNIILGTDFTKKHCVGVSWTREGTRILSMRGTPKVEVEEDELGIPVTTKHHVKIPPRYSAVFEVNMHGQCEGIKIISPNRQSLENNPNMFQHEIALKPQAEKYFPVVAVTNLDHAKTIHIAKGEIVGFAHDEEVEMNYIETTSTLEIAESEYNAPCNWIPARKRSNTRLTSEIPEVREIRQRIDVTSKETGEIPELRKKLNNNYSETDRTDEIPPVKHGEQEDNEKELQTDFLISPGDIYPNKKVKLEDADITADTRNRFEDLCKRHDGAFSKNNKDIGRTTLIEMEIDTGDNLPVAQNPYTLPLKHHEWVRKEIETLEKAGVIERSLSPWASPVIVVPKKSAPDEPPRRRLCVDYRKVNALQQEVKKTDKGTGCLSLYPLPKIDEMFAKLQGSKVYSTIDLRSGYYHIGLTRESRAKSAFVVPMGKWEFKRTPFGLSQAPAYFQLLIDKVLMGCSSFAMGYLDDIIIFSNNELEHLKHLEEIFTRLERFGLKMKREKCDFFKKQIQYLGHLITEEGFTPLPEKLESIRKMPRPKSAKEVKQFLGLIGYYRKFVPRFSDLARSLTNLTRHEVEFVWTDKCEKSFNHLRELLMQHPILRYPDPSKEYTLFTDASGIGWAGVLTQAFEEEKGKTKQHPICYVSGQFRGSQQNWAALTKEAYAIYMSVRKLSFYITDAKVTIKCDHLPLRKFLQKQTLNAKVNNWAVELEQFDLHIEWIQGSKNTLADSLSRLLDVDPEAKAQPEKEGCEFGNYCFEQLEETGEIPWILPKQAHNPSNLDETKKTGEIPPVFSTPVVETIEHLEVTVNENTTRSISLPLSNKQMKELQKRDEESRAIVKRLEEDKVTEKMFILENGVLYRLWLEERETSKCTFVPKILREPLLVLAHNRSGHNGGRRTYMGLKKLYFWPGMRKDTFKHCKNCTECVLQNQGCNAASFGHFKTPDMPMQLICMDLVGPITPVTTKGNKFILTCIDMLTGYTMAIPIPDKSAKTICDAYRTHVYCIFGGSSRILTDNGTEFKNEQFNELCAQLEIKRVYSPVYTPEANGRLEAWHRFFKACVAKHIRGNAAEWDEVVPLAAAAYNFFPCQSAGESPFVLMFGRDPITPFAKLLEPTPRYWGDRGGHLKLDLLKRLYLVTAENIKRARNQRDPADQAETKAVFKVNDQVLVRDVTSGAFAPRYTPHNRVVAVHGPNRIVISDEKGNESVRRASHLKHCDAKTKFASMVPENNEYEEFGRSTKLLLHPKDIPELHFPVENNANSSRQLEINNVIESIVEITPNCQETSEIPPVMGMDYNDNVLEVQTNQIGEANEIPPVKRGFSAKSSLKGPQKESWMTFPAVGISKLSNALKKGMFGEQGGSQTDMATRLECKNEDSEFSFFL